jgi:hypothetical protein
MMREDLSTQLREVAHRLDQDYHAEGIAETVRAIANEHESGLSAIRALVQQLMADAEDARTRGYLEAWNTYQVCANQLAALCPAPPEDQV